MILFLFSALISASYASNSDYSTALDKAKDAAMIQSGVQDNIDQLRSYGESKAKYYATSLGIDKELALGIIGYKVYHDKGFSVPLSKTKRLTVHTDRVELKINF